MLLAPKVQLHSHICFASMSKPMIHSRLARDIMRVAIVAETQERDPGMCLLAFVCSLFNIYTTLYHYHCQCLNKTQPGKTIIILLLKMIILLYLSY